MHCIVPFCEETWHQNSTGITFHEFPSEERLRAAWLKALGRQEARLPDSAVVCSRHFLNEDVYVTESGVRQICAGAVPSTVLVCMACLDTDSELLLLSKHKLQEAYEQLTGPTCDLANLQQTLCVQCAQTVRDFSRFREQSLRARSLMMHLLQTHGLITKRHLELIKCEQKIKRECVTSPPEADDCDSLIQHVDESNPTAREEDNNVIVKREPASPSVKIEIEVCEAGEDDNGASESRLQDEALFGSLRRRSASGSAAPLDPLKCEGDDCAQGSAAVPARQDDTDEAAVRQLIGGQHSARAAVARPWRFQNEEASNNRRRKRVRLTEEADNYKSVQNNECITTHTGKRLFACELCDYKCGIKSSLVRHKKAHFGEKLFACEFCPLRFVQKNNLDRHMNSHTGEKPFACKLCEFKCGDNSNLIRHINTHTGEKPFSCELCQYKCGRKSYLVSHMKKHTGEKPFACELCDYKCRDKSHLVRHMNSHSYEKPFACKLCEYKCRRESHLVSHMKTHTGGNPFVCELCGYKTVQKTSLDRHMTTHTGEKPFACEWCEFKCGVKSSLVRHMKIHTGEKLFACELCPLKFVQKNNLDRHMNSHTGEKPFACKLCEFKCGDNSNLIRHINTHTGEKPFSCELCQYKCGRKSYLVSHMKTHIYERPSKTINVVTKTI